MSHEEKSDVLNVTPEVLEGLVSYTDALGIPLGSSAAEVAKAYKRQSVRWHPDKNPHNKAVAERRFKEVNEAYTALVDPETQTLKEQPKLNAQEEGQVAREGTHKTVTTVDLTLTLEELYRGCVKRREVQRNKVVFGDLVTERKYVEIKVDPGWRTGTRLLYKDLAGPVSAGGRSVDVVYAVKQQVHPLYRRVTDDLAHTCILPAPPAVRRPLRLERLTHTPLGVPAAPLAPYSNFLSELCAATVTLRAPFALPEDLLAGLDTRRTPESLNDAAAAAAPVWTAPNGRGLRLKDGGKTACRLRIPGALQGAVAGAAAVAEQDALCSVAWSISKRSDEVAVGLAPPTAHCDRRFHSDVAKGRWGLVWRSDGLLFTLGSDAPKARLPRYNPGDQCQMTVHPADNQVFIFLNGELVMHEGKKVVGRGDIQVTFVQRKAQTARDTAVQQAAEAGAVQRLEAWLSARGHPKPSVDVNEWASGQGGKQHQAKILLVQKRPHPADGAFDGQPFMGKPFASAAEAADNAAEKALRCLEKLAQRFPAVHALTGAAKRKAEVAAEAAALSPAAKVPKLAEGEGAATPAASATTEAAAAAAEAAAAAAALPEAEPAMATEMDDID